MCRYANVGERTNVVLAMQRNTKVRFWDLGKLALGTYSPKFQSTHRSLDVAMTGLNALARGRK